MRDIPDDDHPAFAPTLHSILDRYRMSAVDRLNAVKALTAITLALAPEDFFDGDGEDRLNAYFSARLDSYRAAEQEDRGLRREVVDFVWGAALGEKRVLGHLGGIGDGL